ncbi:MAG TPA: 4-(cytidine 5'-diphospho)-2-C-methyl-D-erythritol kinase [Ignavibacteria bacterium]
MVLKSCGKINVGLKIINEREDGYHNIETIFYPVNIFDEIDFQLSKSSKGFNSLHLKSDKSYIPPDKSNTCYKAITNFFKLFLIKDCFDIFVNIRKNIPVGGGLGGGSSDAASIIKALTRYFNINISENRNEIMKVALSVGSDVPFFLISKPCFAAGRGDILKLLPEFKLNYRILLVNPNLHISTKWAYENYILNNSISNVSPLKDITKFDLSEYNFENDFEEVVFKKYPELKEIKDTMKNNGAIYSSLSGSGATMFGFYNFSDEKNLSACYKKFKELNYFTYIS